MHHFSLAVQSLRVFLKFPNFPHCMVHLRVSKMWGQEKEMARDVPQAMCPLNPELSGPWQE